MASTDDQKHSVPSSLINAALDKIAEMARDDGRLQEYLSMKSGAERQQALKEARIAAGMKVSTVWLHEETLQALKGKFTGPKGGVDWEAVAKKSLET